MLQHFSDALQFLAAHGYDLLNALVVVFSALSVLCSAVVSVALLIPGAQPEAFFQSLGGTFNTIANFLAKFSAKPSNPSGPSSPPQA